ncbi:MAG TPA: M13 family metallopeptidase [Micropepsaceae bacterium]|nr:M13 family metallopeptidase [Micropepsaceae bacterium]
MSFAKTALAAAAITFAVSLPIGALTATTTVYAPWGVALAYLNSAVRPGDDFFFYANGGWLKNAAIPADRSAAGVDLEIARQDEARLKDILAELSAKPDNALTPEERKLRDFNNAFEDAAAVDRAGLSPVRADLAEIAALKTQAEVAAFLGNPAIGIGGPFRAGIDVDRKNPNAYSVTIFQSGLGMPNRDYYLRDGKDIVRTREAYKSYIADMLTLAGVKDAAKRAAAVYALEARIADAHWPAADRRDEEKTYNPMTVAELKTFAPQFPWDAWLGAAGIRVSNGERHVIVAEKSAFPKLSAIFAQTPVEVWRDYLVVHYLHTFARYLPQNIDDRDFAFYGTAIGGQKRQLPRDIRGMRLLNRTMGEALGKLYVAKYFPPKAKEKAGLLVANILKAYQTDIETLSWMTPVTRAKALEKLHHITLKLGYPDKWRDYSALAVSRKDLIGDVKHSNLFEWDRNLARIDKPVDRSEWGMTPPTNNAYYDATLNEIVFPAGILQPPYFDPAADDAVNYGEIGATIGHEISHGFDDQGSKYDAFGVLKNWWTPSDRGNFDSRTAMLAKQYDAYQPLPGLHINGKLTLGENIADLAGLVIAHEAYRISLGGKPAAVLNGFSGDQRFYIAYAQSWREIWTDGQTRRTVLSNPHSPPKFRVNGVVRNDDGWYAAFPQVKSGDADYLPPHLRVRLW